MGCHDMLRHIRGLFAPVAAHFTVLVFKVLTDEGKYTRVVDHMLTQALFPSETLTAHLSVSFSVGKYVFTDVFFSAVVYHIDVSFQVAGFVEP